VNLALAAEGNANVLTVPPNVAHADDFVAAVRDAREGGKGLWSACEESRIASSG
jgi:micrococcal nuclease